MNLLQQFKQNWNKNFKSIVPANTHFFIAVSGGVDSVVLADIFFKLGFNFTILHCNFQLRGEESFRDEEFIEKLQEKYSKPFLVKRFDTKEYAEEKKISIQLAARELRYHWFSEVLNNSTESNQNKFIVTAHQADDNIETVLMNICRGTGIKGLSGIPTIQSKIIRPLLFARKEQILQYATEQKLQWVEDSSNATDKYSRNFFRHNVLPLIKEVYSSADENIIANIEKWKDVETIYNLYIKQQKEKLFEVKESEIHIPILKLQKLSPLSSIIYEIISCYHFTSAQVDDVIQLMKADNGKYISSSSHRIIKNRKWLILAPLQTKDAQHFIIDENDNEIFFADKKMKILFSNDANILQDLNIACLDAKHIRFPLIVRKWKQGDYFYPLGMTKKKKISRFLIDLKLSTTEKENIWLLESNKKIIWVIGYRIDNRFKLTDSSTKKIKCIVQ